MSITLRTINLLTPPGTLSYALDLLAKRTSADSDTVYLLPSFLQLAPLERRLIELLSNGRLIVLAADPVYGLSLPGMEPAVAPMLEDLTAPLTEGGPPALAVSN